MTRCLWSSLVETARRDPGRVAFMHADDEVTFGQWLQRAHDYAAWLRASGLRPGDRVIAMLPNSAEMAALMFGVWGAEGIVVLLSDDAPGAHIDHAIGMVDPKWVFAEDERAEHIPANLRRRAGDVGHDMGDSIPDSPRDLDRPASIVFTSGSTGLPRGVVQSHGNLVRGCHAVGRRLGLVADDRIICPIRWSFDYGYGQLLSSALLGCTHVLPNAVSAAAICAAIERHRPTVLPGMPSLFAFLLQGLSPFRGCDLSSLRLATNTGGTIPRSVLDDLVDVLEHCDIALNYGLTESYRTTCLDPTLIRDHPDSIGTPIDGVSIAVLRDDLTPCEVHEEGEIVHRGDYVFLGYWNDPEATARTRRPDPLSSTDAPALFTGDYGHLDEHGLLYFHGRRDRLLKSMGVRVSPEEIERSLLDSGLVREAAVFGQSHDLLGDEVWAAVVPRDDTPVTTAALSAYARQTMSTYMAPRRYLIKASLPRTTTGKTCYESLRREASAQPSTSLLKPRQSPSQA